MNDVESRNSSHHDLQSLEREQRERGLREVRERLEQDDIFRPPLSPFVAARPAEERLLYCHHSMYEVRIELNYDWAWMMALGRGRGLYSDALKPLADAETKLLPAGFGPTVQHCA